MSENFLLNCACTLEGQHEEDSIKEFALLRDNCPALNQILIPDSHWDNFKNAAVESANDAHHKPMLFLAYQRGYLNRLTSPIHQFLLSGKNIRSDVTMQYKQDLVEKWMSKNDVYKRQEISRIYHGKLSEIIIAKMLAQSDWLITNLEAWGGGVDIECISKLGKQHAIEVKYIGQEDNSFNSVVKSLKGEDSTYSMSPYSSVNFLIFKIYTAAQQLLSLSCRKIVCIVISSESWFERFEIPLKEKWIKWDSPNFFNNDLVWNQFLYEKTQHFPNIEKDLSDVIRSLDEIWIMRADHFIYTKQFEYKINSNERSET